MQAEFGKLYQKNCYQMCLRPKGLGYVTYTDCSEQDWILIATLFVHQFVAICFITAYKILDAACFA